jgi:hypothetical protein
VAEPPKAIDSRTYYHPACGGHTSISGYDFELLTDPLEVSSETLCGHCDRFVSLRKIYWADTGESVAAYRQRLLEGEPVLYRVWRIVVPIAAYVGAFVAALVCDLDPEAAIVLGGMAGSVAYYLTRLGKPDYRKEK